MSKALLLISILLPVIGSLPLLVRHTRTEIGRRIYCMVIACLTSVCTWALILRGSVEAFTVYSFTRGFSLTFRLDGLGMVFAGMIAIMWPIVTLYAYEYMRKEEHKDSFFAFYIMTYGVTLGAAFSGNSLTMYVFYEMLSIVTIPLVSHYQDSDSLFAGRYYAGHVIGGAATGFIAVVITTMYGAGSFTFGGHSFSAHPTNWILAIYLLSFFGFGVKAAVFPFHLWLPQASVAPTPVTALLHAVAVVNTGVFAVMRMTWYVFSPDMLRGTWAQSAALTAVAVTILYSAIHAVRERHFKRRLAYSTVSNLSYMLYGVLLLNPEGFAAGMAHMVFHGIVKMTLFLCAGAFMYKSGKEYIYEINGVGRKMPWTFTFYTLGALSLTGLPMFCGFISKWHLLHAGAASNTIWAMIGEACLITAAFFCAIYALSITVRAFFPSEKNDYWKDKEVSDPNWRMLLPLGIFTGANILFGLFPNLIFPTLLKISSGLI